MSHTPAPWFKSWEGSEWFICAGSPPKFTPIAQTCGAYIEGQMESSSHNARLIAAAPDLLAALEKLLESGAIWIKDENVARNAIKKARGE